MDPYLERLQQELAQAISDMDAGQLSWHGPGKWSCAEILEHLYLTYTGTIKGCERLLNSGKPSASRPGFKNRLQSLIVVGLGYMPSGRKAPEVARPRGLPPEKVAAEIRLKLDDMDAILARCAAQFGPRTRVLDHPLLGPFSVAQWRKFHLVHGLHHIKQIRRLRAQLKGGQLQPAALQK